MKSLMTGILKSLAVVTSVVLFTAAANANPIVIHDHPGGLVGEEIMWWEVIRASGNLVVVDGECTSACNMLWGQIPPERVCITHDSVFGFHAATDTPGGPPDLPSTQRVIENYFPEWLQKLIVKHGFMKDLTVRYLTADEIVAAGGAHWCSPSEYKSPSNLKEV